MIVIMMMIMIMIMIISGSLETQNTTSEFVQFFVASAKKKLYKAMNKTINGFSIKE